MAKAVKSIARIALPVAGFALGSMVGMPMLGASIGGAIGGGTGGGGLKGAILGGLTGAVTAGTGGFDWANMAGGAAGQAGGAAGQAGGAAAGGVGRSLSARAGDFVSSIPGRLGNFAADPIGQIGGAISEYGGQAVDYISDIPNQLMGASSAPIGTAAQGAAGGIPSLLKFGMFAGNQLMGQEAAADAMKASKQMQAAYTPYSQLGSDAVNRIQQIQSDPSAYIKNNPLYTSLAADAERRLLANKAASGKVGSGGTASELQSQMLNIGSGLVNQEISNLQGQAALGYGAAGQQGAAAAAGTMGRGNAYNNAYQNQINTMLAMSGVNPAMMSGRTMNQFNI